MPELPEVEVIRQGLAPHLTGRLILRISAGEQKLRKPVDRLRLRKWVEGSRVAEVGRRARYLLILLENGAVSVFHLGMTGKLELARADAPRRKHDHLYFELEGGLELRFNDARRFGFLEVFTPAEWSNDPFAHLGPEPLGGDFSAGYLQERARPRRRQPVKSFLMDNRVVAGIGNIYASEILFAAGIRPSVPVAELGSRHWQRIVRESRTVLAKAIACGGTTISDFVNERGRQGGFQYELKVYGRAGQPCTACGTPLSRTLIAGRSTFHCPRCQG